MSTHAIEIESLSKKFKRGESHDSLRDLVPAALGRLVGRKGPSSDTLSGSEFWALRMSPNLIGTDAKADIPLPPNVRRYYFPGTLHGGGICFYLFGRIVFRIVIGPEVNRKHLRPSTSACKNRSEQQGNVKD